MNSIVNENVDATYSVPSTAIARLARVRQITHDTMDMVILSAKELEHVLRTFKQPPQGSAEAQVRVVVKTGNKMHYSRLVPAKLAKLINDSADREELRWRAASVVMGDE